MDYQIIGLALNYKSEALQMGYVIGRTLQLYPSLMGFAQMKNIRGLLLDLPHCLVLRLILWNALHLCGA